MPVIILKNLKNMVLAEGKAVKCKVLCRSATLGTEANQLECIAISRTGTLGTEASKPECIVLIQLATLCTEATVIFCLIYQVLFTEVIPKGLDIQIFPIVVSKFTKMKTICTIK